MGKLIDETGNYYGRLKVLEEAGRDRFGEVLWLCQCDCGNFAIVQGSHLRNGNTKSCGCLQRENGKFNLEKYRKRLPRGKAAFNKLLLRIKVNAKRRKLDWILSDEKVRELIIQPCHYCGSLPSLHDKDSTFREFNGDFPSNGIDRIDNIKGYIEGNVVPCCKLCNRAKFTLTVEEFKNHIRDIYNYFILERQVTQINYNSIMNWKRDRGNRTLPKGMAVSNYLIGIYKRNAKRRNIDWNLTDEEARDFMNLPCYYCGKAPTLVSPAMQKQLNGYFLANGLDRINNDKGYTKNNVVPCCKLCNRAKFNLTIDEFKIHVEKIYKHFIERSE